MMLLGCAKHFLKALLLALQLAALVGPTHFSVLQCFSKEKKERKEDTVVLAFQYVDVLFVIVYDYSCYYCRRGNKLITSVSEKFES